MRNRNPWTLFEYGCLSTSLNLSSWLKSIKSDLAAVAGLELPQVHGLFLFLHRVVFLDIGDVVDE